jgi:large subunit ribosomal protein L21
MHRFPVDPGPENPVDYLSLAIPACRREPDVRPSFWLERTGIAAQKFPTEPSWPALLMAVVLACNIHGHILIERFRWFAVCAGGSMYAVIRTGGKQYRVAPGDVLKIESIPSGDKTVEFSDVLAVSGEPGTVARPATAKVTAEILGEGRGEKILVFHLKRKKQYKKLQGHRQNFTEVRIKAIEADGVTYTAAQ